MVFGSVMFSGIVAKVSIALFPMDMKLLLLQGSVSEPVESHVVSFALFLLNVTRQ